MPLTRSDRVTIITSIADQLSTASWDIIDVTLEQFDLAPAINYDGGSKGYILKKIKAGDDADLIDLAKHLGLPLPVSAVEVGGAVIPSQGQAEQTADQSKTFRIFISHLSTHQSYAGQVQKAFESYGLSSFVAHKDVEATEEWREVIDLELRSCDALVALMHPDFHESDWTDQEIGYVMGRRKPAIAVNFGQAPYGFIGKFQALYGGDKSATQIVDALIPKLIAHPDTKVAMCRAIVRKFADSGSFAESTRLLGVLESLTYWDDQMAEHLKWARKNNSQVYNEFVNGVPNRTVTLYKKWSTTKPQ